MKIHMSKRKIWTHFEIGNVSRLPTSIFRRGVFFTLGILEVQGLLGGSSQLGSVVSNHGDRKSPIPGVVPLINGLFMAYK